MPKRSGLPQHGTHIRSTYVCAHARRLKEACEGNGLSAWDSESDKEEAQERRAGRLVVQRQKSKHRQDLGRFARRCYSAYTSEL